MSELVRGREPRLETYDGAWITPLVRPERHEFRGEVYTSDLELVTDSLRPSANAMYQHLPVTPTAEELEGTETLPGTWLFAGHLFEMFGHDLIEFGTRMWPLLRGAQVDGIVVLPWNLASSPLHITTSSPGAELRDLLGFRGEFRVVGKAPVRVERLLVPESPVKVNDHALTVCQEVFDAVREEVVARSPRPVAPGAKVFLSRRRLGSSSRSPHEVLVETVARNNGWAVVHPQALSFQTQVRLMADAGAIAGIDGSALHLGVFCRRGTPVVALDTRHVINQFVLEELAGLDARHVDLAAMADLDQDEVRRRIRPVLRNPSTKE